MSVSGSSGDSDSCSEDAALLPCLESGKARATLRLVLTAAAGLIADGYDLGVVNIVLSILAHLHPDEMRPRQKGMVVSCTLLGVMLGQLGFGALADRLGRKWASVLTSMLMIVATVLSASSGLARPSSLADELLVYRFALGVGIGGEYPLSASLTKELHSDSLGLSRALLLSINMIMFGVGTCLQYLIVLALMARRCQLEIIWRAVLLCGMLPSVVALILRLQLQEPLASANKRARSYGRDLLDVARSKGLLLCGACFSWFFFNLVVYSMHSFGSLVYDSVLSSDHSDIYGEIHNEAVFGLTICLVQFPCTLVVMAILQRIWRRSLQLIGFSLYALMLAAPAAVMSCNLGGARNPLLYVLMCLQSGVVSILGVSTYVIPSEAFPQSVAGACVGAAAAAGKLGAAVGTAVFPLAEEAWGIAAVMVTAGVFSLCGLLVTWACIPPGELACLEDNPLE